MVLSPFSPCLLVSSLAHGVLILFASAACSVETLPTGDGIIYGGEVRLPSLPSSPFFADLLFFPSFRSSIRLTALRLLRQHPPGPPKRSDLRVLPQAYRHQQRRSGQHDFSRGDYARESLLFFSPSTRRADVHRAAGQSVPADVVVERWEDVHASSSPFPLLPLLCFKTRRDAYA
jgi:hypothetical protein